MGALVLTLVSLAGCSEKREKGIIVIGDDPVVLIHGAETTPQAGYELRLGYDTVSRCLRLLGKEGQISATPVWPTGTKPLLRDGKRGVTLEKFGAVFEGDQLSLGGSFISGDQRHQSDSEAVARCMKGPAERDIVLIGQVDSKTANYRG
ncbi:hypothetical protein ABGB14_49810 [Nonomuraea sp. B10E15]|uniref:hypothetical protein n=1 Tax=Nonomuraea sp. B10E15 TaxID=3153560 RepID=UPI00325D647D